MTRSIVRSLVLPVASIVALLLALALAPAVAVAQDDAEGLEYPGPFGPEESAETSDSSGSGDADDTGDTGDTDEGDLVADEVLGQTIDAQTGIVQTLEGDGAASSVVTPDAPPLATSAVDTGLAAQDDASPALANTGSDIEPIIAISVGMLAVGGSVLVGSRRRLRDLFRY